MTYDIRTFYATSYCNKGWIIGKWHAGKGYVVTKLYLDVTRAQAVEKFIQEWDD